MSKTYLLTRPEHDDTTYYLSNWIGLTIKSAEDKGFKVFDLRGKRASRTEVENILREFSPNLVVLNGHGDSGMVTGHDNQPIIEAGKNESLLKSKIVYAISCKSGHILGPRSIEAGATSYTGYDDDFIFLFEPTNVSRPLQDDTAKQFLETSNLFVNSLVKGNSVQESQGKAKEMLRGSLVKFLNSDKPDTDMVRYLWWDLRHFVSHGDQDAKL